MKAWMFALMMLVTVPAFGRDPELTQWSGAVLANSSTRKSAGQIDQQGMNQVRIPWGVPMFRCSKRERLFINVQVEGGEGVSSEALEAEVIRQVLPLAGPRNITVVQGGTARRGDVEFFILVKFTTGNNSNRNYGSDARSDSWRGSDESTSSSSQDAREWTGTYMSIQPMIRRLVGNGQYEIVAAPTGRISASDSEMTYSSEDRSYQRSESHNWRNWNSSHDRAEEEGYEWNNDEEMAKVQQTDGLISRLAHQTTCLTFQAWQQALEVEQYNTNEDRAAVKQPKPLPTPPAKPVVKKDTSIKYSVTNE